VGNRSGQARPAGWGFCSAVRNRAFQRVELTQRGDQFMALRWVLGQRHGELPQQKGRHDKSGHAAMRGTQPG